MTTSMIAPTSTIASIGLGFNTFTGAVLPTALSSSSTTVNLGLSSQSFVKVCDSVESFNRATSTSAGLTAQPSGDSADSLSGGITAGLANNLNVSDTSISVVVYAKVETSNCTYDACQLAAGITLPVTDAQSLAFYQQYGDSFVSGLTQGGEYAAVFVFYCQTEQDKKALGAQLTGSGVVNVGGDDTGEGAGGGTDITLGGTLSAGLSQTVNNTSIRCSIYQTLLGSTQPAPTSTNAQTFVTDIIKFAQGFSASQVTDPITIGYETQGYETLFGATVSPGFQSIVGNRDLYLGSVGPNLIALQSMRSSYEWIQRAYTTYGYTGDPTLAKNYRQLIEDINGLATWLNGGGWQLGGFLATAVDSGCALAEFNGQLVMAFIGQNQQINLCSSANGGTTWGTPSILPGLTSAYPPALAVFNDQLCLAFTGINKALYACTSSNGTTFGATTVFGSNLSNAGPTLAVAGGYLCLGFVGFNAELNFASSSNGTSFADQLISGYFSGSATLNPALATANGQLYCAYADSPSSEVSGLGVLGLTVSAGGGISVGSAPSIYSTGAIGGALSLVATGDNLTAAWQNSSGSVVTWNQSTNTDAIVVTGSLPALGTCGDALVLAYDPGGSCAGNGISILVSADPASSTPVSVNPTLPPQLAVALNPPKSLTIGTPLFNYSTPSQPSWGGTGGVPYQDINVGTANTSTSTSSSSATGVSGSASASVDGHASPTVSGATTASSTVTNTSVPIALSNLPVITAITLWGGDWMNQIQVDYSSLAGAAQFTHGAVGGGTSSPFTLAAGEFIKSIDGMAGEYVNQLTLTATTGQKLTWPTSPQTPAKFSWSTPAGAVVVGFQGHCGAYLDQLQPIVISVQPAKWVAPAVTPLPYSTVLPVGAIGVGYNSFTGSALPNSALATGSLPASQGVQSSSEVKVCASMESLKQSLSKSSGFSIGVGKLSVGYKKTKTQTLDVTDTSVTVVVSARAVTKSAVFTSCAVASAIAETPASAFVTEYGDSFVSATVEGGEYVAVFVYDCQSVSEQESVSRSLNAGLQTDNYQVGASLAHTLTSGQSSNNVNCTCHQSLIGSTSAMPVLTYNPQTDITNLITFATGFDAADCNAPVVLSYTTTGYESLLPAANTANQAAIQNVAANRTTFTNTVVPALTQLYAIQTQIEALQAFYNTYGYTGDPNFGNAPDSKVGQVAAAINGLNQWVCAVATNPLLEQPLAASLNPPACLANGSPTLNYLTPGNPLWGSVPTTPFQDINLGAAITPTNTALTSSASGPQAIPLTSLPVLSSISLWGASWLNQIAATYNTKTGPTTFTHGEVAGSADFALNLQPGEYITQISGYWGDYINQLTFTTNLGQSYSYPPTAIAANGIVAWTAGPGEVLVGFQGSSGDYLNQLQAISIQLQPSVWTPPLIESPAGSVTIPVTGIGVGYDSFTGSAMPNSAVVPPATVGSQQVVGQQFYQVCDSLESLSNTHKGLNFNLSAGGQSAAHKKTSAMSVTNNSVSVVVYAKVVKSSPIYAISPPTLATAAAGLSAAELFAVYGDSYVSSTVMGAEYVAVLVYECETQDQQSSVMNSLKAQGIVPTEPPVTIGASFSNSLTTANSQTTVNMRIYQWRNGSATPLPDVGATTVATNIANIVGFAYDPTTQAPAFTVDGPGVVLDFATTGYETLLSGAAATAFQPIVTNRSAYTSNVGPSLNSLAGIRKQMQSIAGIYQRFGYAGDSAFAANCRQLNQDTAALQGWIGQVEADPLGTYDYPNPPKSLTNGMPAAQYQLVIASGWGSGGGAWYDLATSGSADTTNTGNNASNPSSPIALSAQPVLASITLWGEEQYYVNQIGTSYQTTKGTVQFVHGSTTEMSGKKSAVPVWPAPPLNLAAGEFITRISGVYGNWVNQLCFTTSRRQSLTWPTTAQSSGSFTWSVPTGATLVGFQGSCGDVLNNLTPVCVQFSPANWSPVPSQSAT